MKVKVNEDACIGCGACAAIAPEVFEINDEGLKAALAQHQLPAEVASEATQTLRDTEFERAHALWVRRFGAPPETPEDKARQMRFLLGRGFASDVVRRVVRGDGLVTDA